MRPGDNSKWAVVFGGIVEVYAQSHNPRQHTRRRASKKNTFLHRPRAPSGNFSTLAEREHGVLVPNHQPVCGWRLVKKSGSMGKRIAAQNLRRQLHES
jgi:hypothetical protein